MSDRLIKITQDTYNQIKEESFPNETDDETINRIFSERKKL